MSVSNVTNSATIDNLPVNGAARTAISRWTVPAVCSRISRPLIQPKLNRWHLHGHNNNPALPIPKKCDCIAVRKTQFTLKSENPEFLAFGDKFRQYKVYSSFSHIVICGEGGMSDLRVYAEAWLWNARPHGVPWTSAAESACLQSMQLFLRTETRFRASHETAWRLEHTLIGR